jgi:predicted transcriptional regulator
MKKPKIVRERLGARERELVDAVFALGNRASAEEIRAHLVNPPGDSSVRVMLARLEKKGFVKHQREGVRYLYSATASPAGREAHGAATIPAHLLRRLSARDVDSSYH